MTWFDHVTSGLTNGQLAWTTFFALTGLAMAIDLAWRRARARISASIRRHPANPAPYDWANDTRLRQAINVHRKAS